jgi:flagellar biosynthesis/type III secretory pathway M-ring protein FliF/YscJ
MESNLSFISLNSSNFQSIETFIPILVNLIVISFLISVILTIFRHRMPDNESKNKKDDDTEEKDTEDEISEENEPTQMITKTNTKYEEIVSSDDFKDQFKSELKKLEDLFSKIERNVQNVQSSSEQLKDNYDLDQILKLIKAYKES